MIWGPSKHEIAITNLNEANSQSKFSDVQYLIMGSEKGEIQLLDINTGKLYSHFVSSHTNAVNDLCWNLDTLSLFSCSTDKTIGIWDMISGKLKAMWEADEEPLHSICVIDNDNLLAASTSVTWWNIKEQTVIKKFSGQSSEILTLLPTISTDEPSNSYFVTASAIDSRISAWILNAENSKTAVASFNVEGDLESIDVTRNFSKKNPLFLSAVMKGGPLYLFKHVLNGRPKRNLKPEMTLHIVSRSTPDSSYPDSIPIIASVFSHDSKFCIIAYGNSENPTFEKVKIVDCPKVLTLSRSESLMKQNSHSITSEVKLYNKLGEYISRNGELSFVNSKNNRPKRKKSRDHHTDTAFEETDEVITPNNKKLSHVHTTDSSAISKDSRNTQERSVSPEDSSETSTEDHVLPSSSNVVNNLLKCLESEDVTSLNTVLQCNDNELIGISVNRIPKHRLKFLLQELHRRLKSQQNRYYSKKWLERVLTVHLEYIIQKQDLKEIINHLEDYFSQQMVPQKLLKMVQLQRLLNILLEDDKSDSTRETDEDMKT
ncbi:WD repeat-containing protein 43 [Trichonephila inaurata madagascariensis]|uniref:WD repeat-containing protein 43 n=1 Tax=Trichonephila inaurata madagascariensis TaxID=2747483 RepID=A0A8X6Y604_9ARAC|nr:WD repeat-containing protein 43 [Trichonephila inaurata madagascariensis]